MASKPNSSALPRKTGADPILRRFLSKAYEFRSVADYFVGDEAVMSTEDAAAALATAKRFVCHFEAIV